MYLCIPAQCFLSLYRKQTLAGSAITCSHSQECFSSIKKKERKKMKALFQCISTRQTEVQDVSMHYSQWRKTRFVGPFLHWSALTRMSLCPTSLEGAFPWSWAKPFFLLTGNSSAGMLNPSFLTTACWWWLAPSGLWQCIFSSGELKWSRSVPTASIKDPIPLFQTPHSAACAL